MSNSDERLLDVILGLQASIDQQTEAIREHNERQKHSNDPQPPRTTIVDANLPPAVTGYYEAEQRDRTGNQVWRWIERGIALLAFGTAVALAVLTYKTLRQVKRQADSASTQVEVSERSYRLTERAWMGFSFTGGNIAFTQGQSFFVPTKLINSGKTPAKKITGHIVVRVVPKDETLDFDYTPGRGNTAYQVDAGTIFPGGNIEQSFEALVHGKKERLILTSSVIDDILKLRAFVVVYGEIKYWDIFGVEHWTHYCRYVTSPSSISQRCIKYNDTDSNEWKP